MLLDLTHTHDEASNAAIEYLCKSVEDSLLFEPHPTDPLIGAVEDLSYGWMNRMLTALYDQTLWVFTGTGGMLKKAELLEGPEQRCKRLEEQVRRAVPGTLPMSTYLEIVDCLMSQYLPPAILENQAQRQAVRQYMAGQYKQRKQGKYGEARREAEDLPVTPSQIARRRPVHPIDEARIRVAQASAARHVRDLSQAARSRMQRIIIDAERGRIAHGEAAYSPQKLQQALLDNFGELNRDWRRVAVTETAINAGDGFLAATEPGARVRWLAHPGACAYCESLHGTVFTVVSPDAPDKDPDTQMWAGKHAMNIGRSIAPRKRTEAGLVDRPTDERVKPAIPAHPGCRCDLVRHIESMRRDAA